MSGLREHVAQAIEASTTCGGPDILRADEVEALMRGALQLEIANNGKCEQADTLRLLAVELGPNYTPFLQAKGRERIDAYYLYCADVSIAAYDAWLQEAATQRRLVAPPRPRPPTPTMIDG